MGQGGYDISSARVNTSAAHWDEGGRDRQPGNAGRPEPLIIRATDCTPDSERSRASKRNIGRAVPQASEMIAVVAKAPFPQLFFLSLAGWLVLLTAVPHLILPGFCSAVVGSWVKHYIHGITAVSSLNRPRDLVLLWA